MFVQFIQIFLWQRLVTYLKFLYYHSRSDEVLHDGKKHLRVATRTPYFDRQGWLSKYVYWS